MRMGYHYAIIHAISLNTSYRLVGLVVKTCALRTEDLRFDFCLIILTKLSSMFAEFITAT